MISVIDAPLLVELHDRWAAACVTFGDVQAALSRPGSWEYQLPVARVLRELLVSRGYIATPDPDAAWRLVWIRNDGHGARRA